MPEQSHPPYDAGAISTPRQLNRWLDVNPQNGPLNRTRKYITVPAFSIDSTWLGYSYIVGEYHYEAPNNFSLVDVVPPVSPNYTCCISYVESDNTVVRYSLWRADDVVIYVEIPVYTGQKILKNFRIEMWSTNNPTMSQATDIQINTSVLGEYDYRYALDSKLVDNDNLCEGQGNVSVAVVLPDVDGLYAFTSTGASAPFDWNPDFGIYALTSVDGNTYSVASIDCATPAHFFMCFTKDRTSDILFLTNPASVGLSISVYESGGLITVYFDGVYFHTFSTNVTGLCVFVEIVLSTLVVAKLRAEDQSVLETHSFGNIIASFVNIDEIQIINAAVSAFEGGVAAYTSVLSDEDGYSVMAFIRNNSNPITVIPEMTLPLTWGACAQPTLN